MTAPATNFHTLFDESVQGLDIGAPVDFRGVRIGRTEVAASIGVSGGRYLPARPSLAKQLEDEGLR